jgi:hypothetical protein
MFAQRGLLAALLLLAAVVLVADPARADGKFFRRLEVADEPGIQAQRALIAFRDGVQTLIVQSDITGNDTSYGWILPLPAEPTAIEACRPNTLTALRSLTQPVVVGYPHLFVYCSILVSLAIVAATPGSVPVSRRSQRRAQLGRVLYGVVIVFAAFGVLPLLSRTSSLGIEPESAQVLQTTRAGVYDVTVLQGSTAEAVERWLREHGFATSPADTSVVADYVADDWCFVAAKVAPDAAGEVTHHPLKVTFPAAQPVYPLRLTGVDGAAIQLDLFVLGAQRAAAPGLRPWFCGPFEPNVDYAHAFRDLACQLPIVYQGPGTFIGLPDVTEMMWPGCVITRLHGRLRADDMSDDLLLNWTAAQPLRARLYSTAGAAGWSVGNAVLAFGIAYYLLWRYWRAQHRAKKRPFGRRLGVAVLVMLAVGAGCYFWVEPVPVKQGDSRGARSAQLAASLHKTMLWQFRQDPPEQPFPEAYHRQALASSFLENRADTNDLNQPGDFSITPAEEGWQLTIIDRNFVPITIPVAPDGRPRVAE